MRILLRVQDDDGRESESLWEWLRAGPGFAAELRAPEDDDGRKVKVRLARAGVPVGRATPDLLVKTISAG